MSSPTPHFMRYCSRNARETAISSLPWRNNRGALISSSLNPRGCPHWTPWLPASTSMPDDRTRPKPLPPAPWHNSGKSTCPRGRRCILSRSTLKERKHPFFAATTGKKIGPGSWSSKPQCPCHRWSPTQTGSLCCCKRNTDWPMQTGSTAFTLPVKRRTCWRPFNIRPTSLTTSSCLITTLRN